MEDIKEQQDGVFVVGVGGRKFEKYPAWRYHEFREPMLVYNTEEDDNARAQGWDSLDTPITSVPHLVNWRTDLEDMNAEQMVLFVLEEFGVELPVEAGEEKLIKAIWRLMKIAPQFKGRMVMLAQTIDMDYDQELADIRKMAEKIELNESREIVI